jgi:probable HAF family extracellular repeat protein
MIARSAYHAKPFRNRASGPLAALSRKPVLSGITPHDINNQGVITGWFFDGRLHGFIKRNGNGNVVALDIPRSTLTEATGINDLDEIVGDFRGEDGLFHGFIYRYRNGSFASIDFPSGGDSAASGINNLGRIVGCYSLCSRGFLYDSHTLAFTPIDVPGALTTQLADINDLGQIVGIYSRDNATAHGFLYDGGSFTFIDVPGAVITSIFGINNSGQISGFYVLETSPGVFEHHAYLARLE